MKMKSVSMNNESLWLKTASLICGPFTIASQLGEIFLNVMLEGMSLNGGPFTLWPEDGVDFSALVGIAA